MFIKNNFGALEVRRKILFVDLDNCLVKIILWGTIFMPSLIDTGKILNSNITGYKTDEVRI